MEKIAANNNEALVEDEDLPQKQRLPKPRLPPTGKISSPRKKPMREPGPGKGHPKKKMRLLEGEGWVKESELQERQKEKATGSPSKSAPGAVKVGSKLKTGMNAADIGRTESRDSDFDMDDDVDLANKDKKPTEPKKINGNISEGGMISPESLEAS